MSTLYKIGNRVWMLDSRKTDGRYNRGKIVGIDMTYPYMGFQTESSYLAAFEISRYKVAYVDVVTGKGQTSWELERDLSKERPEK